MLINVFDCTSGWLNVINLMVWRYI